jgi:hypothetical protein
MYADGMSSTENGPWTFVLRFIAITLVGRQFSFDLHVRVTLMMSILDDESDSGNRC